LDISIPNGDKLSLGLINFATEPYKFKLSQLCDDCKTKLKSKGLSIFQNQVITDFKNDPKQQFIVFDYPT